MIDKLEGKIKVKTLKTQLQKLTEKKPKINPS